MVSTLKSADVMLDNPPEDSISHLAFSPVSNHLAVSSWDSKVRIYEVDPITGKNGGKSMFGFDGPVLSTAWSDVCIFI